MKEENYTQIQFPSKSANEGYARTVAACFAAQLDPTLEEINDIKTAVSEAVTNAIVHGYPDKIGKIVMKLKIYPDSILELSVQDWGVGIPDVEQAKTPMYTTGAEDRAGMGFTIMESFMDTMKIKSKVEKGTTVILRRKFKRRLLR